MTTTKTTNKAATTKTTTKAAKTEKKVDAKKVETKKTETKKVQNAEKQKVDMKAITELVTKAGVKVYNPDAKGNYRIFGTKKGSSLNVQSKAFIIYSTDDDFKAVKDAKLTGIEATENGNSQDKVRPNVVKFSGMDMLKSVLAVYAKNPMYSAK